MLTERTSLPEALAAPGQVAPSKPGNLTQIEPETTPWLRDVPDHHVAGLQGQGLRGLTVKWGGFEMKFVEQKVTARN